MDTLRLFLIAILPGITLALALYLTDKYDREPIKLLLRLFFLGIIIALPSILVEQLLSIFNIFPKILSAAYSAFIVAGFTEEFFKRMVVMKYAYSHIAFNEKLDGIVYAVFVSLGFATIENVLYVVFSHSDFQYIGLTRGILSVPAHALFAITMGYYISLARFCPDPVKSRFFLKKALFAPIILHGIFDFILMVNIPIVLLALIPFVIYMWIVNLKKLNLYYKESKKINTNLN